MINLTFPYALRRFFTLWLMDFFHIDIGGMRFDL